MNKHNLVVFSQNVRKNKTLTDTILETQKTTADIIFVQEPPHFLVKRIPSHTNPDGDPLYGTSNHPDWTLFILNVPGLKNPPRVAIYINKCLAKLRFSLRLDLINHRNINVVAFHNHQDTNLIINVYSDSNQTALQVLRDNIRNLERTIAMAGDFNIRDSDWDPSYYYHSNQTEDLLFITDSLNLKLSQLTNPGPTRFVNNHRESNSVLDLVFLAPDDPWFGQHTLAPELQKPSDHIPLIICMGIRKENIVSVVQSIKKDSEEEHDFIAELKANFKLLNMQSITDGQALQSSVNQLSLAHERTWAKHSKPKHITRYSKEWWNQECTDSLNAYRAGRDLMDWKTFKSNIRIAKRKFFDDKIYEIASSNKRPWDLMNWVKKKALPAIETITHEGRPCNSLPSLWNALHCSYNSAANRPVNTAIFNDLPRNDSIDWPPFSKQEFRDAIAKCSSLSTPGPDHISWRHLKPVVTDNECLERIIDIANACITYKT